MIVRRFQGTAGENNGRLDRHGTSGERRESDKDGEREKERGGELTLKQHNKETTLQSHRRLHFMFLNNRRSQCGGVCERESRPELKPTPRQVPRNGAAFHRVGFTGDAFTDMGSEPPSSPQVVEDGGEEDEEELSGGEEADLRSSSGRGSLLTRRGITLRVLLKDGLVEPGDGVLAIHYLGKNFVGDLLNDGKIRWVETGQIFNSPSAWATHCKRLVNPAKKSGCGWASVRYRGQKLVQYKTTWLHKYQPSADMSLVSEEDDDEDEEEGKTAVQADEKVKNNKPGLNDVVVSRRADRERIPVRYCTLGTRDATRDPHTLVELSAFSAINRFQPFNVAVSSNVLLLMDFHCHLTTSEVVGYLGGRWDTNTQLLTVLRAFPCRTRLADRDSASAVEEEICQNLFMRGLSLVGWYHSHPRGPALPSLQDIDSQMDHQLRLQGSNNGFQPCLGIICGPYYHGNQGVASTITPFWVVPPPEQRPNDYGIPVAVEVTYVQDNFLTSDVLNEMMLLVDYYRAAPDLVQFSQYWCPDTTMMDKIKGSLSCHAPKDQAYSQILEHVYSQLNNMH